MDTGRLLDGLDAGLRRLRAVAGRDLAAAVPTCPEWTVEDLVRHVANGYLNVVVRRLRMPEETPVQDLTREEPLAALDRCYAALTGEFAARNPDDQVGRDPQETVRFWIRRMAHETAIHRVDAELAVGQAVTPIPEDLAVDGVDEMLTMYLAYETRQWRDDYAADLNDWAGRWALFSAGEARWRVTVRPEGVDVAPVPVGPGEPAARVLGDPAPLMLWLYNRGGADQVAFSGDDELIAQLRRLLTAVTSIG